MRSSGRFSRRKTILSWDRQAIVKFGQIVFSKVSAARRRPRKLLGCAQRAVSFRYDRHMCDRDGILSCFAPMPLARAMDSSDDVCHLKPDHPIDELFTSLTAPASLIAWPPSDIRLDITRPFSVSNTSEHGTKAERQKDQAAGPSLFCRQITSPFQVCTGHLCLLRIIIVISDKNRENAGQTHEQEIIRSGGKKTVKLRQIQPRETATKSVA